MNAWSCLQPQLGRHVMVRKAMQARIIFFIRKYYFFNGRMELTAHGEFLLKSWFGPVRVAGKTMLISGRAVHGQWGKKGIRLHRRMELRAGGG
jgi:hypothetical protein